MHLVDHAGSAAALATLTRLRPRAWLEFVAASVLIDLDHFPGAARKYGVTNPLDGARFAITGRMPGWAANDARYPVDVRRPLHRIDVALGLALLALLSRRFRPLAMGLLWHLFLDVYAALRHNRPPG